MVNEPIKFTIHNIGLGHFWSDFVGSLGKARSPYYPIYVTYDSVTNKIDEGFVVEESNIRIVETNENSEKGVIEIAKVSIEKSFEGVNVVIDCTKEGKNRWGNIIEMAQSILKIMWDVGYRLSKVSPGGLIPITMIFQTKEEEERERVRNEKILPLRGLRDTVKKPIKPPIIYLPKSENALKKWKKAYSIIKLIRKEYKDDYECSSTDNPNPKISDYVEAILNRMNWNRGYKTIERIIKAGDANLLK